MAMRHFKWTPLQRRTNTNVRSFAKLGAMHIGHAEVIMSYHQNWRKSGKGYRVFYSRRKSAHTVGIALSDSVSFEAIRDN